MAITGDQIRAARGFLDWTRDDLAGKAGISAVAIKNIETNDDVQPQRKTLEAIQAAFANNGIEFTPDGVRRMDDMVRILEGSDAYMRLLDDIFYETASNGGELLFLFADERVTYPAEQEMEERIRANGVRFRILVEEGSTDYRWPLREYRHIPSQYFNHDLQAVYGDKVAQVLAGGQKIMVVNNPSFATTARNLFNMIWASRRPLEKSDAE